MIYFDNAAGMPVNNMALAEAMPYIVSNYINPNGQYAPSRDVAAALEEARHTVADCIGAEDDEIFFVGSGTLADNIALQGMRFGHNCTAVYSDTIEHEAILNQLPLFDTTRFIKISQFGEVDCDNLEEELKKNPKVKKVATFMMVNNEIGTINDIQRISEICHKYDTVLITDAIQAVGHIPIDVKKIDCDMLTGAGQKFGGMKGCAFLYKRRGLEIPPIIFGGGQERGLYSGTQNVAGIIALATALDYSCSKMKEDYLYLTKLNNYAKLAFIGIKPNKIHMNGWNGTFKTHYAGNLNLRFDGIQGIELLEFLSENNICVSTGSACSSGKPSHVLQGIGLTEEQIESSIRFSFAPYNTEKEVDEVAKLINYYLSMRGIL